MNTETAAEKKYILGLESAAQTAGAALYNGESVVGEYALSHQKTHSQTLLPMVDSLLRLASVPKESLAAVAVSEGPGSFTGLRIGAATAKAIGDALDIPLLPVPTLAAMAYNAWGFSGVLAPVLDARRQTVYSGLYRFADGALREIRGNTVRPVNALTEELNGLRERVLFLGSGYRPYAALFAAGLTVPFQEAPPHMAAPRAASVAVLGHSTYSGRKMNAAAFAPVYLRLTQAERERLEREKKDSQREKKERHDGD